MVKISMALTSLHPEDAWLNVIKRTGKSPCGGKLHAGLPELYFGHPINSTRLDSTRRDRTRRLSFGRARLICDPDDLTVHSSCSYCFEVDGLTPGHAGSRPSDVIGRSRRAV